MALDHDTALTIDNGIHFALGFGQVRGAAGVNSGRATLDTVASDAMVWETDAGNDVLRIDTLSGTTELTVGDTTGSIQVDFKIGDGLTDAFIVQDSSGNDFIHVDAQSVGERHVDFGYAALISYRFFGTGAVRLTQVTTTERDAIAAENGMLVFNTTTAQLETYDGTWDAIAMAGVGSGTDDALWYVNQDATTATEDSELRLGGGNAINETRFRVLMDSDLADVECFFEADNAGGGTFTPATFDFRIGNASGAADVRSTSLSVHSGTGTFNREFRILMATGSCTFSTTQPEIRFISELRMVSGALNVDTVADFDLSGDFTVDCLSGVMNFNIQDANALAFQVRQASNDYIVVDTVNGAEAVFIGGSITAQLAVTKTEEKFATDKTLADHFHIRKTGLASTTAAPTNATLEDTLLIADGDAIHAWAHVVAAESGDVTVSASWFGHARAYKTGGSLTITENWTRLGAVLDDPSFIDSGGGQLRLQANGTGGTALEWSSTFEYRVVTS